MGGMGGMGGAAQKRYWLRMGNDPQKSGFAREDGESDVAAVVVAPQGRPEGEPLPRTEPRKGFAFEMPGEGFYRLYVTSRKLQGEVLAVSVAKAEFANFGHGGDEDARAKVLTASRILDTAPMEIVRERGLDEKPFFQLKSGDEQSFLVLLKGLPAQGVRVRFVSHQGWTKEATTDEQGRVRFQIVRDYFPSWDDFQKRFKATYLLIADTSANETGSFNDETYSSVRYQATLAGSYYPSPDDYRSYAWGLGIGLGVTTLCGLGIYAWRRRRSRPPYREVSLNG